MLPAVAFAGLNRPFCLEYLFPRLLSSRIPGGQGTLIRVPSWWHFTLALSQRLVSTLVFALLRASLRRCVDSVLALSRQRIEFSLDFLQRRLDFTPSSPCSRVSCPRPVSPYAPGSNASGFAATFAMEALSAPPTSSVPYSPYTVMQPTAHGHGTR